MMFSNEKRNDVIDQEKRENDTQDIQNVPQNDNQSLAVIDPMEDDLNVGDQQSSDREKIDYARLMEMMTKKIDVTDLPDVAKQQFSNAIQQLRDLKAEIIEKKEDALATSESIREKVYALREMKIVSIDEQAIIFSDERLKKFVELLDAMAKEIARSIEFYQSLIALDHPAQVVVMRDTPDAFDIYILDRVKNIKGYVKKAKKDLAVSFSRYTLGFDYQRRQVEHIEELVKNIQHSKE